MILKLCFYVPEANLEPVKQAIFKAGAGQLGEYSECCWQVLGEGQFRPSARANPAIGQAQQLEIVAEYRVECLVEQDKASAVLTALLAAHPYEEPAYDFCSIVTVAPTSNLDKP